MFTTHFCGNEISEYGKKNGYVDYRAFAKSFDGVLNNEIMAATADIGYWEQENGFPPDNSEKIEELAEKLDDLEYQYADIDEENTPEEAALALEIEKLKSKISELEEEQEEYQEIFQYYIVSDNGARIISEFTNDPLFYNETLDMYVWGVTHYGTSWDYVLTDIPCTWK